jgi:hypothetical protein
MQFLIATPEGKTLYKPGTHSREALKYAFKALRGAGHGSGSILLGAVFHELYPHMSERFYRAWQRKVGICKEETFKL